MKTLQINAFYKDGSTGRIVERLIDRQKKEGIDAYAIYWHGIQKTDDSQNIIYTGNNKPFNFIRAAVLYILFGGRIDRNPEISKKIVDSIKKINPDIIHLHNLHGSFDLDSIDIVILFDYFKKINIPILWTFHDINPITGRCYHFEYKECSKWQHGCIRCPQRFFDREGVLVDRTKKNWLAKKKAFDAIKELRVVAISNWVKLCVQQSYLKNRKIDVIYNGIDIDVFKEDKRKETREKIGIENKFAILAITWTRRKGANNYIKLAKMLRDDEVLVVVGNRPPLRRLRRLPANIISIPTINNEQQMAQVYSACDVYFNSSAAETFGLTTAEALSCGTPVVGYNSTATPEIIGTDGSCGFVAQKGNLNEAYEKMLEIKRDGRSARAESCRKKACSMFDVNTHLNHHIELYKEIFYSIIPHQA